MNQTKRISLSTISELESDIANNNKNSWNENEYEMDMRKIVTKKIDDGIMCCDFELWLHKNCIKCELLNQKLYGEKYYYNKL